MSARIFEAPLREGFIELPFDAKAEFGRARAPVTVSINGFSYPTTIAVYSGRYMVPVRKDRQEAAKVKPGDQCNVTIVADTTVRKVEPPPDLKSEFTKNRTARRNWGALSFTHKREYAEAILSARRPETRARRVREIVGLLSQAQRGQIGRSVRKSR